MVQFVYSDMETYRNAGLNFLSTHCGIGDALYPPGAGYFYAVLHRLDPSWRLAEWALFVLSCATPVILAGLGRALFGRRVGWLTLAMASLYFPWIDYFAFFLSEGPFTFFTVAAVALLVAAIERRGRPAGDATALASGVVFIMAASCKSAALAWLVAYAIIFLWWQWRSGEKGLLRLAALMVMGGGMLLIPLGQRCTTLNEGRFCAISTNGPMNVLLGHVAETRVIHWNDRVRGMYYTFGGPPAVQRGYTRELTVNFGAYDQAANLKSAAEIAKADPFGYFVQSTLQVFNLFGGSVPWPSADTAWRRLAILFQQLFTLLILLPALFHLRRVAPSLLRLQPAASAEIILCIPLLVLMAVSFATLGEPRLRIPLDGFLMILAAAEILHWFNAAEGSKSVLQAPPSP